MSLASAPASTATPATAAPRAAAPVRVASVPASHVYVEHLSPPDGTAVGRRVERLADPPSAEAGAPAAQWWPPTMLSPAWVRENADSFDVFHIHFGFDARTPAELSELVAALAEAGKPLVYTVHDLRNPHHADRSLHDAQLDVLVPAADALVTLTRGAAAEIRRRWGRDALVVPHPHVVPAPLLARPRPARPGGGATFRIGVHTKSVRASMVPGPVIEALLAVVPELPGARLVVNAHTDVVTPGTANHDAALAALLRTRAEAGDLELAVHDFLPDDALWDYLQGLDLSVLPYRFGTHSGWLEACHDLGTAVLAPTCGFYAEQRPCLSYRCDEDGVDTRSLAAAVRRAYAERPHWRADPGQRWREREAVAQAHLDLYTSLR